MDIRTILGFLEGEVPLYYACDWDNSGLQVGRAGKDINRVYVALDATEEVVNDAVKQECDMILTHHPLLFKAVKNITSDTAAGRKLITLLGHDMTVYSMHTSFDAVPGGMADLAGMLLQLEDTRPLEAMNGAGEKPWGIGIVGNLNVPVMLDEFCGVVKKSFHLEHVNVFSVSGLRKPVCRVACCPGSGRSMLPEVLASEADVFLTGDIGHHEGLDLVEAGVNVIDAGHHGLEKIFVPYMAERLKTEFPELEVFCARPTPPFVTL